MLGAFLATVEQEGPVPTGSQDDPVAIAHHKVKVVNALFLLDLSLPRL